MGSEIKVQVIHKETIKPSSPTPSHITSSSLSVFDQLTPDVYARIVLFYPPTNGDDDRPSSLAKRSKVLKKSLSEALTRFYIFAGELKYNFSISCNDQGALFVEASVNCPISKILDQPELGIQKQLLPNGMEYRTQSGTRYVLLVQANLFECGGLAIGVSLSHKAADGSTLGKFISSWAAIALGFSASVDIGTAASRFPPLDFLNSPDDQAPINFVYGNVVKRLFVFDAPKIAALKFKAASTAVPNPSAVEVVSALVWKCAMEASRTNMGFARPSAWNQAINIRRVLLQPLGDDVLGNLTSFFIAKTEVDEVVDLQSLVGKLREGFEKFKLRYANGMTSEEVFQHFSEYGKHVGKDGTDNYCSSSTRKFPFYSVDFGWGKPTWADFPASGEIENMIMLLDASDGKGIEAHVTLKEVDMALFQTNQELLAYAPHTTAAESGFYVWWALSRI